jgi:hypothetical protein
MNEEQKAALDALYNTYSSQGYSVSKAFREMGKDNPAFNSGEARMYMQELYNTSPVVATQPVPATQEPKKKSQDGSQSGSTSGTGSGVSRVPHHPLANLKHQSGIRIINFSSQLRNMELLQASGLRLQE